MTSGAGGTDVATPELMAGGSDLATPQGAVSDSMSVAVWTIISRFTGVLRGVTVAAVLGATYFANTYQFTNSLPNLVFYGLLAGSLFSSILVPALVPHIDSGDRRAAARTAGGLLGLALVGMLALVPVVAVLTPVLLHLGSAGATDPAAAQGQAHIGAVLVLLLLPQVPLYAVVGTAAAVMNAHRRFALAAAAPALENLGTIAVLGVVAVLYARAAQQRAAPTSLLLLLGLGTTGAVLLHAGAQWWGARRVGIVLVPRAGWRDPQVRAVVRRALPALAQAALAALQLGALLVVADRVAGGVVAFQLATSFYFLPIAVGATPVALSLVPRLSRMTAPGQAPVFRDTYVRGLVFASFLVIPAATAYAVLARPLAGAIAFGHFSASGGAGLLAASLTGLAPGIIGETLFLVTTYACYARQDTTHPLRGMIIQTVVCAGVIAACLQMHGPALLTALGLGLSAGSIAAALYLVHHLRRGLPPGGEPALRPLLRTIVCSAIMIVPAWATATFLAGHLNTAPGHVVAMLAASVVGASVYFALQAALHAPQMTWVAGALRRGPRRPGPPGSGAAPVGHPSVQHPSMRHPSMRRPSVLRVRAASQAAEFGRMIGPVLGRLRLEIALLLGCAAIGVLTAISVKYAVTAMLVLGLSGWVLVRPATAGYLLIFLTPLVVGVDASHLVPLLRPNEALMVLFGALIGLRWLAGVRTGDRRWPRLDRVDIWLIALGLTSSVVPLMMMVARQRQITPDDLLYCIVIWKLLGEYVIVRATITTREQAMRCLVLSMISAAIVSAIAILQSLGLFGVPALLAKFYAPLGVTAVLTNGRGSSLLGLPAAVADLAILNLVIAIAMIVRGHPRRLWLGGLAALLAFSVLAAAEFSTVIALLVALGAVVALTKSGKIVAYGIPVALLGGVLLWPVIEIRLSGFHSASGLPISWITRLRNLQTYFWPTLFSDFNWIFGVRPSARVVAPNQQYGYVWIESGYTWLLWGGGIPLLASYLGFGGAVVRKGWAFARRADAAGIAGTAVAAALCAQMFSMILDPHLTYRGAGDAVFLILALVRVLPSRPARVDDHGTPVVAAAATPRLQEVFA
ncbi:MAG: putative peptidoglycan lipid flippase [Streptosporangiaceae bacterium]|nr:putative peptidoglycan lipid flippase [Streptosporangiaceae bacterium]